MACNVIYNPTDRYDMRKGSYATCNATASAAFFGTPITGYSLKKDLAKAAFDMKSACQNDAQVSVFIEKEKQKLLMTIAPPNRLNNFGGANFGNRVNFAVGVGIPAGPGLINNVSITQALTYNATGEAIVFVNHHIWKGNMVPLFPHKIENGQMRVFVHLGAQGSKAAMVYRVKGSGGKSFDWMFAWDNTQAAQSASIRAYTEIKDVDSFSDWSAIEANLNKASYMSSDSRGGLSASVVIDGLDTCSFYATITLA